MTLEFTSPAGIVMAVALFVVLFAIVLVGAAVVLVFLYWAFIELWYKFKRMRAASWYFFQYMQHQEEIDEWLKSKTKK